MAVCNIIYVISTSRWEGALGSIRSPCGFFGGFVVGERPWFLARNQLGFWAGLPFTNSVRFAARRIALTFPGPLSS